MADLGRHKNEVGGQESDQLHKANRNRDLLTIMPYHLNGTDSSCEQFKRQYLPRIWADES